MNLVRRTLRIVDACVGVQTGRHDGFQRVGTRIEAGCWGAATETQGRVVLAVSHEGKNVDDVRQVRSRGVLADGGEADAVVEIVARRDAVLGGTLFQHEARRGLHRHFGEGGFDARSETLAHDVGAVSRRIVFPSTGGHVVAQLRAVQQCLAGACLVGEGRLRSGSRMHTQEWCAVFQFPGERREALGGRIVLDGGLQLLAVEAGTVCHVLQSARQHVRHRDGAGNGLVDRGVMGGDLIGEDSACRYRCRGGIGRCNHLLGGARGGLPVHRTKVVPGDGIFSQARHRVGTQFCTVADDATGGNGRTGLADDVRGCLHLDGGSPGFAQDQTGDEHVGVAGRG